MLCSRLFLYRMICICVVLVLVAAVSEAAERRGGLVLDIVGDAVEVSDGNGRAIQSLPFDGEAPDEDNREYFAIAEDMNFDGFTDVRVLYSRGNVNAYYDCWLWRPEDGVFVMHDEASMLANPVFDQDTRTVRVFERGSAVCHVTGELGWENGKLVWLDKTVQDEAEDGERIVVRRYRRGSDGELRLVCERTGYPHEFDGEGADDVCRRRNPSGLNLVLGCDGDLLDYAMLPNGEWWLRRGSEDRCLLFESRRLAPCDYGEEALRHRIGVQWPQAREIDVAPFPALVEKTGYPVLRADFLDGENEDTREFVAALVFTEEWSFFLVVNASADAVPPVEGGADGSVESHGRSMKEVMENVLLSAEFADPAGDGFLPASGPVIHCVGDEAGLPISVMDALIRIKKIVGPEESPWIGSGGIAYRYDGPGQVGDTPALLFSFGGDTPEKFTAERHFAVDASGAVFEMDVVNGGEYWRWDELGALWWGEYRRGDAVLRITNYREGPSGMYFVFDFSAGGTVVFDGVAPVRGRTAVYGSFVFSLAENNDSVSVEVSPEAVVDGGGRNELAGLYRGE